MWRGYCGFNYSAVKKLRKGQNLSLKKLGNLIDMDKGNLSRLERGKIANPPILTVFKLSVALEVPIETFISKGWRCEKCHDGKL